MSSVTHTFQCPAKVNLALSVGSAREDGYHPISSWMVRVSLYDDLAIERVEGEGALEEGRPSGDVSIRWAPDAPAPGELDWPLERDLAVRAHRLMEQHVGRRLPIRAELSKRIPVGAGLAGGSSDGATMLQALNEMFELDVSHEALLKLAGELGSDLTFFFSQPSAIVGGVGERIEPAPLDRPLDLVLILPALQCETGAVYRKFDEMRRDARVDEQAVRKAAGTATVSDERLFNDLAEAALAVEPQLADVHFWCEEAAERPVHVTGSGAGLFALAESYEDASRLAEQLRREARVAALAVRTL